VFEAFGPLAERTGAVLVTALGYDYVPGNLAGALALQAAGPTAARVRVGYFVRGNLRKVGSAGTRASVTGLLLEPGYAFRGGRIVTERIAAHLASFELDGTRKEAFSIGSSEQFALPRLRPPSAAADGSPAPAPLTDVGVYPGRTSTPRPSITASVGASSTAGLMYRLIRNCMSYSSRFVGPSRPFAWWSESPPPS
jgi:hypothetical protein